MTLKKIRKIFKLKEIQRSCSVGSGKNLRKESSAEHSWSCLILADYFLTKYNFNLDRLKVYELLMYHDLVEIESGDVPVHHEEERKNKKELEKAAMKKLSNQIPPSLSNKFTSLFTEFENNQTQEAKFALAIDKLDAAVHAFDHKPDWKGWNEAMLRKYIGSKIEFEELKAFFEEIVEYVKQHNYI